MSPDLWLRGCERLAAELPEQQYNTWIRPLPAAELSVGADGAVVQVRVPNRFKLDWIRSQYASRIESILSELAGAPVRLSLSLAAREMPPARPLPANGPVRAAALLNGQALAPATRVPVPVPVAAGGDVLADEPGIPAATPATTAAPAEVAHASAPGPRPGYPMPGGAAATPRPAGGHLPPSANAHRLNTALTFDTLVAGRANQMARTAALHVAGAPGVMYNPLFIYGGVGLGKTHLIHAVGNALLKDRPDARVLYLHAEQFISDVVKNYQRKTFDELKAKYHSLDLLLIDDVQFFAGKDRTQEEFFNAFEALLAKRAHIIMTSDTYPKGLVDIDERLTSRFDAGLTVAIEPPELEMRVAILIKKALAEGTDMPEDVAFFIAKNVRANVRELEGALRKVLAYSRFSHKDININLAREALKDLLSIQNRQISVENIQKTVADFYKIKVADMYSKKRPASIAKPRQIAMYLAKELTQKSLPEIGELFGGRDHTTVLHAVRKIGGDRTKDSELNQQLHVLEQTLKG
ncbi:chromosomal replication initiator protein DnaA [Ideonella sp. DXS22W]|uniref:Chromosomal replication initiator protein DnaA n=1 Tax=Pseudaquabacterium inlustre TaxID=2984192 RepID=A0ABU9CJB8_9BURK